MAPEKLERSNRLLHGRPPFNSMASQACGLMIREQSIIIEFCGDEAVTTLADILIDPVDRNRPLNLVLDVAGPVEEFDPPTLAVFRRFQAALLRWRRNGAIPTSRSQQPRRRYRSRP
jgi:hypothetical protein